MFATLFGAGVLVVGTVHLSAHHSAIAYDRNADVELTGTVREFQYTNPHSWLFVQVVDKAGQTVDWGFEAEGPSTLLRAGIKVSYTDRASNFETFGVEGLLAGFTLQYNPPQPTYRPGSR